MLSMLLILNAIFVAGPAPVEFDLEYVRPAGDQFVLECTASFKKTANGFSYESVTHRTGEKMTLQLRWDVRQTLLTADLEHATTQGKQTASATFDGKSSRIKRPGQKDQQVPLAAEAVLATTAPDWSDILLLLRRYDQKTGGKQSFVGLWFHPGKPPFSQTFTVEEMGKNTITSGGKELTLLRTRVQLRSGAYFVWADVEGKVFKLIPAGQPTAAVILKGEEKTTAGLSGK